MCPGSVLMYANRQHYLGMAIVEFGAGVTKITGSIGGWTFQRSGAGFIVRNKPLQRKFSSPKQTEAQANFVSQIQAFQELSPGDKLTWGAFADSNPKENKFGQVKALSGQNWFTSVNSAKARLSLGQLSVPPANLLPEVITSFNLVVDATKIEISAITPNNPADTGLFIDTTFPITRLSRIEQSAFRETDTVSAGPFGTIDLTTDWETAHKGSWPPGGFATCINIGVSLQPVRLSTGITGPRIVLISGLDFVGAGIGSMEIESTFIVS